MHEAVILPAFNPKDISHFHRKAAMLFCLYSITHRSAIHIQRSRHKKFVSIYIAA